MTNGIGDDHGGVTQFKKTSATGEHAQNKTHFRIYCNELAHWKEHLDDSVINYVNEGPTVAPEDKWWFDRANGLWQKGVGATAGSLMYVTESQPEFAFYDHPNERLTLDVSTPLYLLALHVLPRANAK